MIVVKTSRKKDKRGRIVESQYDFHACDLCGIAVRGTVTDPAEGRVYEVCNDHGWKLTNQGFGGDGSFYPPGKMK